MALTVPSKPLATKLTLGDQLVQMTAELAQQIDELHGAMQTLERTRLKRKALLVLLSHHTGMGQREIERVLEGLATLRQAVLK